MIKYEIGVSKTRPSKFAHIAFKFGQIFFRKVLYNIRKSVKYSFWVKILGDRPRRIKMHGIGLIFKEF